MKLDITEEEFQNGFKKYNRPGHTFSEIGISYIKSIGIGFRQEIDWEAETHDPSVIPKNWLIEGWDNGYTHMRVTGFFDKENMCAYTPHGGTDGGHYNNYRAIKKEDWPKWAIEAHKSLED